MTKNKKSNSTFVDKYRNRMMHHTIKRHNNETDPENGLFTKHFAESVRYTDSLKRNYPVAYSIFDIMTNEMDVWTTTIEYTYSDMSKIMGVSIRTVASAVSFLCHNNFIEKIKTERSKFRINTFFATNGNRNSTPSKYRFYKEINVEHFYIPNSTKTISVNEKLVDPLVRSRSRRDDDISVLTGELIDMGVVIREMMKRMDENNICYNDLIDKDKFTEYYEEE